MTDYIKKSENDKGYKTDTFSVDKFDVDWNKCEHYQEQIFGYNGITSKNCKVIKNMWEDNEKWSNKINHFQQSFENKLIHPQANATIYNKNIKEDKGVDILIPFTSKERTKEFDKVAENIRLNSDINYIGQPIPQNLNPNPIFKSKDSKIITKVIEEKTPEQLEFIENIHFNKDNMLDILQYNAYKWYDCINTNIYNFKNCDTYLLTYEYVMQMGRIKGLW